MLVGIYMLFQSAPAHIDRHMLGLMNDIFLNSLKNSTFFIDKIIFVPPTFLKGELFFNWDDEFDFKSFWDSFSREAIPLSLNDHFSKKC
jgi:hypothetical protein